MSNSPSWKIAETLKHIEQRFGSDQSALALPSLYSVSDRLDYARYHFQEIFGLLDEFQKDHKKPLFAIQLGSDEERVEFELFKTKTGANAVACVQSLHSIPDLLAHAIYFSLGINLSAKAIEERKISCHKVAHESLDNGGYQSLKAALAQFLNQNDSKHVAALSNKAKHRAIVKPLLYSDYTKTAINVHEFRFEGFEYSGKVFPETPIADVLEPAYNIAMKAMIDAGNEINRLYDTGVI